ncbi:MAG: hypothetical protein L0Y37_04650 [Bacteroidales bacterium]|nr:hypothetical protein [Bacteroidales bacterium]
METADSEKENSIDSQEGTPHISLTDFLTIAAICIITGLLIHIPKITGFDPFATNYYVSNTGIIAFFGLIAYSLFSGIKPGGRWLLFLAAVFAASALFMNLISADMNDQAYVLACIHLPLLMWCIYGMAFTGFDIRSIGKRVAFIRHNGDMAILGALIVLSGMLFAGFSIGLFESIDISTEKFFTGYIAPWGVVAAPAVTAFIIHHFPRLTGKIAPIIATLFSPIVLFTLIIYLLAVIFTGKDPYSDRDFLIMFNMMLLAVMAIIVFSISESPEGTKRRFSELVLLALSVVTLIVDLIALSAIFYRLGAFGPTPNRIAVLGSNLLILGNLILITIDLFRVTFRNAPLGQVSLTTARYLPWYMLWTIIVTFGFPLIFQV